MIECPHETPGGAAKCAVCRVDGLERDFGYEAERIERYGRIIRSRHEVVERAGVPMPDGVRAALDRALHGSAAEQPAMFGDEAEDDR